MNKKVVIIGSGEVGATLAYSLMLRNIADTVCLLDVNKIRVHAEISDIAHGMPLASGTRIIEGTYKDCNDSNLIIITAGRNRKPGESRRDLAESNLRIMEDIAENIGLQEPGCPIMIVSNPVDLLVTRCSRQMNLRKGQIFGTGCLLDTSRLICRLAAYIGCRTTDVTGYVIGEHGDGQQIVWSTVCITGEPIEEYCSRYQIKWDDSVKTQIETDIKKQGETIIKGKGRTHYGISTCVCYVAEAILTDKEICVPVSTVLNGEYGINDIALSLPCIVGKCGVKKRIEIKLKDKEQRRLCETGRTLLCSSEIYKRSIIL